jgi:hypothetical protein
LASQRGADETFLRTRRAALRREGLELELPLASEVASLKTVTAAPGAAALMEGIRDFGYWLGAALADVIDNSITKHASVIEVETDMFDASPSIIITDNGVGMSETDLRAAMVLGSQDPRAHRDATDLGRFGLGLKTASFSQCRRLTVATKANKTTSAARWDLDLVTRTDEWLLETVNRSGFHAGCLV